MLENRKYVGIDGKTYSSPDGEIDYLNQCRQGIMTDIEFMDGLAKFSRPSLYWMAFSYSVRIFGGDFPKYIDKLDELAAIGTAVWTFSKLTSGLIRKIQLESIDEDILKAEERLMEARTLEMQEGSLDFL